MGHRGDQPAREVLFAHPRRPQANGNRNAGMDTLRGCGIQGIAGGGGSMSERLPKGIRRLLRIGSVDRDLDEELAAHFQYTIDELVSRGYTRETAQQEAFKRFGDWTSYRKQLRTIDVDAERQRRWSDRFDALHQSIGHAVRSL